MKIREISLDSPVMLAPMAGVTNQAFKFIVRSQSDCVLCTEMVNDKALLHDNEKTKKMVEISELEHPVTVQLFGSEVSTMVEAAKYLDKHTNADIIDINMGCPAPKITKNMSGSKILKDTDLVYEILKNIVENVDKPVTVKMRLGWDKNSINIIDNVIAAEKAGVSAIAIHGRTTKQFYTGEANWEWIKKAKEAVNIPIIGNGDIDSPQKAKQMMEYSGVDGVMVGRAAMGNPWLLHRIEHYLIHNILLDEPTIREKLDLAKKHLRMLIELKGEKLACLEMRAQAPNYIKGIKGASKFKQLIQTANIESEFIDIFKLIMEDYE